MEWVWGVFQSCVNYALKFIYSITAMKAVIFTAMYWVLKTIWDYALELVGGFSLDSVSSAISAIPQDVVFFLLVFRLDIGLPMLLAAWVLRFAIRRIPVIG